MQLSPRMASLRQGDVFISFFQPSRSEQGYEQRRFSYRQAEAGRVPWGRSLCMLIRTKAAKQGLNERKRFSLESKVTLPSYKSRYLRAQLGMLPSKVTPVINHRAGLKTKFCPLNPSSLKNYWLEIPVVDESQGWRSENTWNTNLRRELYPKLAQILAHSSCSKKCWQKDG